jgi:steroid delta-isomerase-like uncharacterized protein
MDVKQMAQHTIEVFNDRSFRTEAKDIADADIVVKDLPSGQEFRGVDGFVQFSEGFVTAMPDIQAKVVDQTVNGNNVTTRVRGQGTFTGTLATPLGTVPGNGNMIAVEYTLDQEFNEAGKLVRFDINYNLQDFMAQLGLPMPPS